ncbi:hypothetical protein C0Q70_08390 [Pomacea canaliculata]|uniref:Uncharacterized protein n=1 Tax=Pomacea canaliculata TaxID=400727 RepID=A0A2T7PHP4_POMCA|nr:hypothetical protein C0Q70_08390 [Pomacea canaliculata]
MEFNSQKMEMKPNTLGIWQTSPPILSFLVRFVKRLQVAEAKVAQNQTFWHGIMAPPIVVSVSVLRSGQQAPQEAGDFLRELTSDAVQGSEVGSVKTPP